MAPGGAAGGFPLGFPGGLGGGAGGGLLGLAGWGGVQPPAGGVLPQMQAGLFGQWIHGPSSPQAVGALGLYPGCSLDVVLQDGLGAPVGTASFVVRGAWPADARGAFVEVQYVSCSAAGYHPMLQAVFGIGQGVVHLCTCASSQCVSLVTWAGRPTVHADTFRATAPAALGGAAPLAALPGAAPAGTPPVAGAGGGAALLAAAPAAAAAAPKGDGGGGALAAGAAAAPDGDEAKELRKKLEKAKVELSKKRDIGSILAARADAQIDGAKRKKKKKRKNNGKDDDGSESSSFSEAPPPGSGRRIKAVSREVPGALLASGLEQIKQLLAQRGGAESESDLNEMASMVVQYITSVWHGRHPPHTMGLRNVKEMRMIGECIDALTAGRLPQLGDILMQRLKAIEQATKDGHWQVAQHLELVDSTDIGLASQAEVSAAASTYSEGAKLKERLGKAGGGRGRGSF